MRVTGITYHCDKCGLDFLLLIPEGQEVDPAYCPRCKEVTKPAQKFPA